MARAPSRLGENIPLRRSTHTTSPGAPPLVLRQVQRTRKGRTILSVTSLRDERALANHELGELYRQRWGIEVFHRSLKQTFGRGKLRSTSPDHAVSELSWSLVALDGVQLVAVESLRDARR